MPGAGANAQAAAKLDLQRTREWRDERVDYEPEDEKIGVSSRTEVESC